ncbi:MAG: hypothetical protein SFT94_01785 [Pseudanabaenaceae cyanobacterium bins.68]|nr:hypothetical protein [Pseudanabaenaceae cyanobacterium bins.68]
MPRFQSNFFNWIDSSLPVKWGRQARRWLAMQQQPNPTTDFKFNQKQAVELVTGLIAALAQTLTPRLGGQHSDQAAPKWVKSNPVGDFGSAQTQLPGNHSPKQLTGISGAIAALVKRVKAWLVGSRPAPPDPPFTDPEPDYWSAIPTAQPQQIPDFSQIKLKQDQLATNQSWWEEMQNLLRSAIAYFLAKDARSKKLSAIDHPPGVEGADPSLALGTGKNSAMAHSASTQLDNWLDDWHDYDPARVVQLERKLPSSGDLTANSSPGQVNSQDNSTGNLTKSRSPSTTIAEWTNLSDLQEQEPVTNSPLHAWIETRSEFLGYAYDPMMAVVHWCDRWVAALERFCQKIFQALICYWRRLFQNPH